MKHLLHILLISVLAISSVMGGHIWVEDPVLEFQNAYDINNIKRGTIWITFMLQSGLGPDDFFKITFPEIYLQMNALIYSSQLTLLNSNLLKDANNQNQIYGPPSTAAVQPYYWSFGVALAANTWYKLQLTFFNNILQTNTQSQTFFNSPWTIATVSSPTDPDFIYYDENLSAGLIARAAPPVKFKNVNITQSTTLYNSLLEAANDIYIDIDTTYGYDNGAFFEVTMNNNDFSFKTSCSNMVVSCAPNQAYCFNLTAVSAYTCNLQKVESTDNTTRQLLFEFKSPIVLGQGFRIKTTVINPFYYTATVGGVYVRSYSRFAKLWYEEALVLSKFSVSQIIITNKLITYFWGLQGRAYNTSYSCPVGIYVTPTSTAPYFSLGGAGNAQKSNANINNEFIVNKLRVYFQITSQDFPAGRNYQLTVQINSNSAANMIYTDSSYSTNMPLVSGKRLMCQSDIVLMQINCKNIGDAKLGSIYWFGVAFILLPNSLPAAGFGAVTFKVDSTGTGVYNILPISQTSAGILPVFLTDSANNAGTHTYNDFLSSYRVIDTPAVAAVGYGQLATAAGALALNKVVSIATDTALTYTVAGADFASSDFATLVTAATGASGIVYSSSSAFKILLLIEAAPEHLCGIPSAGNIAIMTKGCGGKLATAGAGTDDYFGGDAAGQLLDLPSTFYAAHTIFKCIFNVAMMSTYDTTQMQKGLQIFGGFWAGTLQTSACDQAPYTMCTVQPYDSYLTNNKTTQDNNKLWNYIELIVPGVSNEVTLTSFGEATLSCNSIKQSTALLSAKQYCSAVQFYVDSATGQTRAAGPKNYDVKSPAVIFRNVKFSTSFTGNPLYPNQNVFDFIICFRFVNPTTVLTGTPSTNTLSNPGSAYIYGTQEGTIASYGIFQSTVVWIPQSTTYFKVSFVNFYQQNDNLFGNLGAVMPSLLRFGGRFNSTDFVTCDALGVFLDQPGMGLGFGEQTTDSVPSYTNNVGCGAISASILCSYFSVTGTGLTAFATVAAATSIVTIDNLNVNNMQYIHFNQLVIFKGIYTGIDEFNHFVPVLPDKANFPTVAMIGQFHETTTAGMYDTLNHFIRFSPFKSLAGYTDKTVSNFPPIQTSATGGNLQPILGDGASTQMELLETNALVCTANGPAPNSASLSGFVNYLGDILPAQQVNSTTGLQIDAALAGSNCIEMQANNEYATATVTIDNNGWGAAFSVSSQAMDPFPDATNFTWPYTKTSGYPSNKCLKYSYLSNSVSNTRVYMITCPIDRWLDVTGSSWVGINQPLMALDQNDQAGATPINNVNALSVFTTTAGWKLTIQPFTCPWNWGLNFNMNEVQSYAWSNKYGNLLYFRSPSQLNLWTGSNQQVLCSIGAVQQGWNRNGNAQMVTITTTLKTVSIQLTYLPNQNVFTITENFNTAMASNDLISGYCTVQGVTNHCSVSQSSTAFVFTVTVPLLKYGTQTTTVSAGTPFIINYWVNARDLDPTVSVQHGAIFQAWNQMYGTDQTGGLITINDCFTSLIGASQRLDYTGSTTPLSQTVTVNAPYYMYQDGKQKSYNLTTGARGWFDQSWSVSRAVYKFTQFQIDLSWIGNAQSTYKSNMHCVPHSSQKVNFQFATLSITSMSAIDLKPKMGWWTNEKVDYSLTNTDFSVRCFGGAAPSTTPTSAQRPTVKWNLQSTLIISGQTMDLSNQYTFTPAPDQSTTVVLNQKTWGARGAEATYTFKFTPFVSYDLGARLIFEFSRAIPGKFNRGGAMECIQDGVPLYCFLVSERTVTMLINRKFDNSSTPNYGYNITLRGVAQPDSLDAYKKIFIAIDLDQDFSNGVNFVTELYDSAVDSTTSLKLLPVLQYSQSVSETKVTYTLNANLKMPKTTVAQGQVLYAQFPGFDYARVFFHGFTPICTFIRQGDNSQVNLANNCSFIGNRKVKIYLNLDNENLVNDLVYLVTISAVPTPLVPTTGGYVVEFVLVDTSDFPIYRSNKGHFNATPTGFVHNNLVRLQWYYSYLQVYNGVYNAVGNFSQNDGLRFSKSFSYSFKGLNASSFRTYPKVLGGVAGTQWAAFYVGAEVTTAPGYYQILFDKNEQATINQLTYATIEPLDLEVQPFNCTIGYGTSFDIVAGGRSLPIIFSFAGCLPLSDVTLTGNVTDFTQITAVAPSIYYNSISIDFSIDFHFNPVNDPMLTLTSTFIQFDHTNISAPAKPNAAKVHVNLAGTNKASYNSINDIVLNVVVAPTDPPVVSQLIFETYNGGMTLTFSCTQEGTMYWALSTSNATLVNLKDSDIYAQSLLQGFTQTVPAPNDRYFTTYGYTNMPNANTAISVKVINVASLRDYSVVAMCSALSNQVSQQRYINFTQYDNLGRGVIVFGNFSAQAPRANLAKFVCALASAFRLTNDRVFTQYGDMCSIFRTRMLQTTQTTGSTTPITPDYVHPFVALPNYFANSDSTFDEINAAIVQPNFVGSVNAKLLPDYLGSVTFKSIQPIRSKSSTKPSIPTFASYQLNPVATRTSGVVTFAISNQAGYIFVLVGDAFAFAPTIDQLKVGQTGNGTLGIYADTEFIDFNTTLTVTISGLTQCTKYQWWFAASELDPTLHGYNTDVYQGNNFVTQGCPTFARIILIGFFFALFTLFPFILL